MEKFKIEVQVLLARTVEVKEKNVFDAISKVNEQYKKAEIALDYNDFIGVDFIDVNSQGGNDEKNNLMKEIIDYIYADEVRHFEEMDEIDNHIFSKLERLKVLLD